MSPHTDPNFALLHSSFIRSYDFETEASSLSRKGVIHAPFPNC